MHEPTGAPRAPTARLLKTLLIVAVLTSLLLSSIGFVLPYLLPSTVVPSAPLTGQESKPEINSQSQLSGTRSGGTSVPPPGTTSNKWENTTEGSVAIRPEPTPIDDVNFVRDYGTASLNTTDPDHASFDNDLLKLGFLAELKDGANIQTLSIGPSVQILSRNDTTFTTRYDLIDSSSKVMLKINVTYEWSYDPTTCKRGAVRVVTTKTINVTTTTIVNMMQVVATSAISYKINGQSTAFPGGGGSTKYVLTDPTLGVLQISNKDIGAVFNMTIQDVKEVEIGKITTTLFGNENTFVIRYKDDLLTIDKGCNVFDRRVDGKPVPTNAPTNASYLRKTFFDGDRYWVFTWDSASIWARHSIDGKTWSKSASLVSSTAGKLDHLFTVAPFGKTVMVLWTESTDMTKIKLASGVITGEIITWQTQTYTIPANELVNGPVAATFTPQGQLVFVYPFKYTPNADDNRMKRVFYLCTGLASNPCGSGTFTPESVNIGANVAITDNPWRAFPVAFNVPTGEVATFFSAKDTIGAPTFPLWVEVDKGATSCSLQLETDLWVVDPHNLMSGSTSGNWAMVLYHVPTSTNLYLRGVDKDCIGSGATAVYTRAGEETVTYPVLGTGPDKITMYLAFLSTIGTTTRIKTTNAIQTSSATWSIVPAPPVVRNWLSMNGVKQLSIEANAQGRAGLMFKVGEEVMKYSQLPLSRGTLPPWSLAGGPLPAELGGIVNPATGLTLFSLPLMHLPGRVKHDVALSVLYRQPGLFTRQGGLNTLFDFASAPSAYGSILPTMHLDLPWIDLTNQVLHLAGGQEYPISWYGDPDGNKLFNNSLGLQFSLQYYKTGNVYLLDLPSGLQFQFDSAGLVTLARPANSVSAPWVNDVTFSYSGGSLSYITDTMGRTATFAYSAGKLTGITYGALTVSLTYTYPSSSVSVVSVVDGSGQKTELTVTDHLLTRVDLPTGGRVDNTYASWVASTEISHGENIYALPLIRRVVYEDAVTGEVARSVTFTYRAHNGRVSFVELKAYDDNAVLQGTKEYRYRLREGLLSIRSLDAAGAQVGMEKHWYSTALGQSQFVERFVSTNVIVRDSTTETFFDDWGNPIYLRDATNQESFSSFANTNHQGHFYAPGLLNRTTDARLADEGFDFYTSGFTTISGTPTTSMDESTFWRNMPSFKVDGSFILQRTFPASSSDAYLEFNVRLDTTATDKSIVLSAPDGSTRAGIRFYGGSIYYYKAAFGWLSCAEQFTAQTWLRFSIVTFGGSTYRLYRAGSEICLTSAAKNMASSGSLFSLRLESASLGAMWIDDIKTSSGNSITVTGLKHGHRIYLYDLEGLLIAQDKVGGIGLPSYASTNTFTKSLTVLPFKGFENGHAVLQIRSANGDIEVSSPVRAIFGGDAFGYTSARSLYDRLSLTLGGFGKSYWAERISEPTDIYSTSTSTLRWVQTQPLHGSYVHENEFTTPGTIVTRSWTMNDLSSRLSTGTAQQITQGVYFPQQVKGSTGLIGDQLPQAIQLRFRQGGTSWLWVSLTWGTPGIIPSASNGNVNMGPIPDARSRWVILSFPTTVFPSDFGTSGVSGMEYKTAGGSALWDVSTSLSTSSFDDVKTVSIRGKDSGNNLYASGVKCVSIRRYVDDKLIARTGQLSGLDPVKIYLASPPSSSYETFETIRAFPLLSTIEFSANLCSGPRNIIYTSPVLSLFGGDTFTYTPTNGFISYQNSGVALFTEKFDGVSAPAFPSGWSGDYDWGTVTGSPDTAPNTAFTSDPATVSDKSLYGPTQTVVSSAATLTFRNNYNTESSWDGGVLEVSLSGGAYQDIVSAGGTFTSGGYNSWLNSVSRNGWTGNSGGYITTTVALPSSMLDQSAAFRWRFFSDSSVSGVGWRVDTVTSSGIGATATDLSNPIPRGALLGQMQRTGVCDSSILCYDMGNLESSPTISEVDVGEWWHVNDFSGNGKHGRLRHSGLYGRNPVVGQGASGLGMWFTGGNAGSTRPYVEVDDTTGNFGAASFSVSFWIWNDGFYDGIKDFGIMDKVDWNTYTGWSIRKIGNTNVRLYGWIGSDIGEYAWCSASFGANAWHNVVITVARGGSNTVKYYFDGTLKCTAGWSVFSTNLNNNGILTIAEYDRADQTYYFNGGLDGIALFDRVLTDNDAVTLYRSRMPSVSATFLKYAAPPSGVVTAQVLHEDRVLQNTYTYDARGSLASMKTNGGNTTSYRYSTFYDRSYLTSVIYPDATMALKSWDRDLGVPLASLTPDCIYARAQYDKAGRPVGTQLFRRDPATVLYFDMETPETQDNVGTSYIKDISCGGTSNSNNGNDGVLTGTTEVNGIAGKARSFNGGSDVITVPDAANLDPTNRLTISTWVYRRTAPVDVWSRIVSKEGAANGYHLWADSANALQFCVPIVGVYKCVNSYYAGGRYLTLNRWHHVLATYDGAVVTLAVDGISWNGEAATGNIDANSDAVKIGNQYYGFDGIIDETMILNRVPSASEKADLFQNRFGLASSTHVAYDDGTAFSSDFVSGLRGHSVTTTGPESIPRVLFMDMETTKALNYLEDLSGHGNTGKMFGPTTVAGKIGNGLNFDGINDYVEARFPSQIAGHTSWTVSFWMKWQPQATRQWPVTVGSPNLGWQSVHFIVGTDSNVQFGFWGGTQNVFNIGAYQGIWAHYVTTYDKQTMTSYVNGALVDSDILSGGVPNIQAGAVYIGKDTTSWGEAYFKGDFDEFHILPRALTAGEVSNIYSSKETSHMSRTYLDGIGRQEKSVSMDFFGTKVESRVELLWNDLVGKVFPPAVAGETGKVYSYTYDFFGRSLTVSAPLSGSSSTAYDDVARQVTQTDAIGRKTRSTFDVLGRTTKLEVWNPVTATWGNATVMNYAVQGRVKTTDPNGKATTDYGGVSVYPDGTVTWSTLDNELRLSTSKDATGRILKMTYNNMNRVTTRDMGAGAIVDTFSYDLVGRVTQADRTLSGVLDSRLVFTYDSMGLMTREEIQVGPFVGATPTFTSWTEYIYDSALRLVSLRDKTLNTVDYKFDSLGRVSDVVFGGTHYGQVIYDAASRVSSIRFYSVPWGQTGLAEFVESYTYDLRDRITQIRVTDGQFIAGEGATVMQLDYTYNAASELTATTENMFTGPSGGSNPKQASFFYDGNGQLRKATGPWGALEATKELAYTFDSVGNIVTRRDDSVTTTYSYDSNGWNKLTSLTDGTSFIYNSVGSLVEKQVSGVTDATYTYNAYERLTRVTKGANTYDFFYDAQGRQIKSVSAGSTTYYGYAGDKTIYTSTAGAVEQYVYLGPRLLLRIDNGASRFYHPDVSGNVRAITTPGGNYAGMAKYNYEPFGKKVVVSESPGFNARFTFAQQEFQSAVGLHIMGVRSYDPVVARFTQRDPIGDSYDYGSNNPISFSDTSGLAPTNIQRPGVSGWVYETPQNSLLLGITEWWDSQPFEFRMTVEFVAAALTVVAVALLPEAVGAFALGVGLAAGLVNSAINRGRILPFIEGMLFGMDAAIIGWGIAKFALKIWRGYVHLERLAPGGGRLSLAQYIAIYELSPQQADTMIRLTRASPLKGLEFIRFRSSPRTLTEFRSWLRTEHFMPPNWGHARFVDAQVHGFEKVFGGIGIEFGPTLGMTPRGWGSVVFTWGAEGFAKTHGVSTELSVGRTLIHEYVHQVMWKIGMGPTEVWPNVIANTFTRFRA